MNTPEVIEALEPGQVFVFGSNAAGAHEGGAARVAFEKFGAVWGQGEGLQGASYAIPTMGGDDEFHRAVRDFHVFAMHRPDLTFLVTKVGCGIAGYTVAEVAPYFDAMPANVILPTEFEAEIAENWS